MFEFSASAPGKLFLSGEYAVLENARAVITAVDRRVTATTTNDNVVQSKLIRCVKQRFITHLARVRDGKVGRLPNLLIDSNGFSTGRVKLGIGSSAAVAAATAGALFAFVGMKPAEHRESVLQVAMDGHWDYQEGKGSGADVATSVYGGTIVFQRGVKPVQVAPLSLETVFVWSGKASSTTSLVGEVKRLLQTNATLYQEVMMPLVECANVLSDAYIAGDASGVVELTRSYGSRLQVLAEAAGIPIFTPALSEIARLALETGGAAKPSGAGGGDGASAFFIDHDDACAFVAKCQQAGFGIMELSANAPGLRLDTPAAAQRETMNDI